MRSCQGAIDISPWFWIFSTLLSCYTPELPSKTLIAVYAWIDLDAAWLTGLTKQVLGILLYQITLYNISLFLVINDTILFNFANSLASHPISSVVEHYQSHQSICLTSLAEKSPSTSRRHPSLHATRSDGMRHPPQPLGGHHREVVQLGPTAVTGVGADRGPGRRRRRRNSTQLPQTDSDNNNKTYLIQLTL